MTRLKVNDMKGQIGSKHYDTETAELIKTLPNGFIIYRKRGRSNSECFLYNPRGKTVKESFFPLSPEDSEKYLPIPDETDKSVYKSGSSVRLSNYDRDRIKRLALRNGMSMAQFILMLVDEYERTQIDE